jgi:hypothetical protein
MKKSTLLNKLNNVIAAESQNRVVVESLEQVNAKSTNDALQSVYDGTIRIKELLNIEDAIIDMTKCENPITVMQKIYSAGSKVGETTTDGQNMYMIDVTAEDGFKAFKEGLKELKVRDSHTPYESVWIEGYNMFKQFNFTTGQFYVYYVVTNEEMRMLQDRIKAMSKNKMTVEDAKALQADLPPFIRAWQESSIDVSKDKDKVFDIAMDKVIGKTRTLSQLTKKYRDNIDFGFGALKNAKRLGKAIPEFKYTNALVDEAAPVIDLMGHVSIALQEEVVETLNGNIRDLYVKSNNNAYAPFVDDAKISKELALFIKGIYSICYAAKSDKKKISKEDFALFRDVIYTTAAGYEVAAEDVVRIAIAVAMTTVYKDKNNNIITKDADVDRFSQYPVTSIFPEEYVAVMTNKEAYEILNPEEAIYDIQRDIEDNEEITFVNGVSEDGMIELYDTDFNGTVIEYNGQFYHFIDIYAYNEVNALLANERTFKEGATTEELLKLKTGNTVACDNGEFFRTILDKQGVTKATVTGANANLLKTVYNDTNAYLCQFVANCDIAKGQTLEIANVKTYRPTNGTQQAFLIVLA